MLESILTNNWFVCQDFGFCQDFVSMEKEGRISILRGASFTWVKNRFFVQFFESKDNLYFYTLLQKFKNTFPLAGITYMTEDITKYKVYWRHARGTYINDVRFFLAFLDPPSPPIVRFLPSNVRFFGVILDPPSPPKIGHHLWMFPYSLCWNYKHKKHCGNLVGT